MKSPDIETRTLDFDTVYQEQADYVYRLALRLSANSSDADDVFQEVFLRVYRFSDGHRGGSLKGWLRRITMNVFFTRNQKAGREIPEEGVAENVPSLLNEPGTLLEEANLGAKLEQAIQSLAPEMRAVLVLRSIEELSYQEIAEILEVPIGTVRSRLARARGHLMERLGEGK